MASSRRAAPPPLALSGEIDLASAGEISRLAATHLELLEENGGGTLTLDLAAVTFIDSTGIGALVALRRAASQAGGRLKLVKVPKPVARLLELSGMGDWVESQHETGGRGPRGR